MVGIERDTTAVAIGHTYIEQHSSIRTQQRREKEPVLESERGARSEEEFFLWICLKSDYRRRCSLMHALELRDFVLHI